MSQCHIESILCSLAFLFKGEFMSKINPGSNFNEDNDIRTPRPGGMQDTKIIEPKIADKNKLQCPICDGIFSSREAYISHFLSKHQIRDLTGVRALS